MNLILFNTTVIIANTICLNEIQSGLLSVLLEDLIFQKHRREKHSKSILERSVKVKLF